MPGSRSRRAAAPSGEPAPYAAFLRGINVGGRNIVPMADLADLFASAGCEGVRTYIQSGNVAFAASLRCAARVPAAVQQALAASSGVDAPVIIRSAAELDAIISSNPFLKSAASAPPEKELYICFLQAEPVPQRIAALDPNRSPGDAFIVRGREVYLHLPNGVGRSKLTNAWLDSALETTSTIRNWRTLLNMREMLSVI